MKGDWRPLTSASFHSYQSGRTFLTRYWILMKKLSGICWILWLSIFSLPVFAADLDKPAITVFAAASLTNVLQDLGDSFTKDTSIPVKFSFAASSTLARQIESGAPADIFFSADLDWMDYLQKRNLIQAASRRDVVG